MYRVKPQFSRFHHAVAVDVVDGEFFGVVELERGNQVFARAGGKPFGQVQRAVAVLVVEHDESGNGLHARAGIGGQRREGGGEDDEKDVWLACHGYAPATVILLIRIEPILLLALRRKSLPVAMMFCNISFRLPAMVMPETAWRMMPFSTQNPAAPRE